MTEPPPGSLPRPDLPGPGLPRPGVPGPGAPGPGLPAPALPGPELDADGERLASLLADLANDPHAPPSTVTAESVLAAVRAQALSADAAAPVSGADVASRTDGSAGSRSDGEVSGGGVVDGRKRFQARRALLVGVLAAACLAAVAAVVVPLSLRSSETVTSAESALDTAADSNAEAGQAGEAPRQTAADQSAADLSAADLSAADLSAAGSSAAQAPEAAGGQADAALPSAPAPAEAGGSAAGSPVCTWSPLSADAAAALTQSLPPGRFGAPGELIAACAAAPVAGALLPDSTGGSLVITVSNAKPGACSSGSSNLDVTETGIRCVSQGSGRYLSTDAGGGQTAYTYANGLEVAVGKNRSGTGLPEGSQLTADQVLAAAEAVLGTLG